MFFFLTFVPVNSDPHTMIQESYGTILIVDDNPNILLAARLCLGKVFAKVLTHTLPEKLLSVMNQEHIDVVLLDMNFTPGTNSGTDGLHWLQTIHRLHPDVPVVLVTAYADIQLAVRGLKEGAADFVTKPWDNNELVRVLTDAVDKSRRVSPLEQIETEHIQRVLDKCDGNVSRAAELLHITRQTLYAKLKR